MADLEQIVNQLSDLTVIEAAELSKLLEEKWGVSAAAPVAVAAAGSAPAGEAAAEEKDDFTQGDVEKMIFDVTSSLDHIHARDLLSFLPPSDSKN